MCGTILTYEVRILSQICQVCHQFHSTGGYFPIGCPVRYEQASRSQTEPTDSAIPEKRNLKLDFCSFSKKIIAKHVEFAEYGRYNAHLLKTHLFQCHHIIYK